jgi:peptidyl-prolyl cis-trans isomerase D
VKRQGGPPLPARVISEVFRTAKDAVGSAEGQNPTDRVIFRVTEVNVPAFDANSATTTRLLDQLKASYGDDVLSEYVARLENDVGTNINRSAVEQAVGRTPSEGSF